MLRFAKRDVRSLYRVKGEGHTFGDLRLKRSWTQGSLTVDGIELEFLRDRDTGVVEVRRGSTTTARAWSNESRLVWTIESEATTVVLTYVTSRRFEATVDGSMVGSVALVGATGRRVETDLPADCPIDSQLLGSFLAIGHWNRAASS